MNSKKWTFTFILTTIAIILSLFSFNYFINPFGAFTTDDWHSYNITTNPRVAKISYLDEENEKYDSFIVGASSTSSFDTDALNELFDANFYNMIMYGSDMLDCELTIEYLIENYTVNNIILNVYLGNGVDYNFESNNLTNNLHYNVDNSSVLKYYYKYLTANPKYAYNKLVSLKNDTYIPQVFDVFNVENGTYDKILRDIEPIQDLDSYFLKYPEFIDYKLFYSNLPHTDNTMQSISRIKDFCEANNVNFVVVTAPVYYEYLDNFSQEKVVDFYTKLANITDYWDFSISSVSYEPRYFYDATHFRNNVGTMAIARMSGDKDLFIPDDFGFYVTAQNVENHFKKTYESDELEAYVPILTYHHFAEVGDEYMTMGIDNFEMQIKALADNGYQSISFEQLINYVNYDYELPKKPVIITIDDGYSSNYELAYPILQKYNMQATIFVIGVSVGKDTYKDTDFDMIPHFSFEEAQEMVDSGLISIQNHTYDLHQWQPFEEGIARNSVLQLEGESESDYIEVLRNDFSRNISEIEENLSIKANVLAYPLGYISNLSEIIAKECGIEVTLSVNTGINTIVQGLPQTLFSLKRFGMTDLISPEEMLNLISTDDF